MLYVLTSSWKCGVRILLLLFVVDVRKKKTSREVTFEAARASEKNEAVIVVQRCSRLNLRVFGVLSVRGLFYTVLYTVGGTEDFCQTSLVIGILSLEFVF